jgi:ribosome-binding protein aMBF1 (putative translation factor)
MAISRSNSYLDAVSADDLLPDDEITLPSPHRKRNLFDKGQVLISQELSEEVANFARAARFATGLGRKAFAKKSGVKSSYIAIIEDGPIGSVSLTTLEKIARAGGRRLKLVFGD